MIPQRGFSLAELFLSLGLIAALATLGIVYAHRISETIGHRPAEDSLRQLVTSAHSAAGNSGAPTFLSFNSATATAEVHDSHGILLDSVALSPDGTSADYQIRFYRILPEAKAEGEAIYEIEETPIPYILFHPSGPSVPAEIHLSSPRTQQVITIDPFCSSPRLARQSEFD